MYIQLLLKNSMRALFLASAALIALAFVESAVQLFGTTLVGGWYSAGRLLEIAAALLVFVIAVLLREIRDELHAKQP